MSWTAAIETETARPAQPARAAPVEAAPALGWRFWPLLFAATMFTQPVLSVLIDHKIIGPEDGPMMKYFWIPVYIALAPVFWSDRRIMRDQALRTPALLALLVLAALSTAWSVAPDVSIRRALGLFVTMAFAWRVAALDWRKFVELFACAWAILAVGSFAFAVGWPSVGVMGPNTEHPGAWSGVWPHKNLLGNIMGLGVSLFVIAAIKLPQRRLVWLGFALAALVLVAMSTSATAKVIVALGLAVVAFGCVLRAGPGLGLFAGTAAIVAVAFAAFVVLAAPELIFNALGRDATLTGRTDIWSSAIDILKDRPAFGYGFGAFWQAKEGPAFWVRQALGWNAPNAHNGWLDLALSLGLVGVFCFAASFLRTAARTLAALFDKDAGLFAPSFLLVFAVLSMTEGYVLDEHNAIWALFVVVATKLAARRAPFPALAD